MDVKAAIALYLASRSDLSDDTLVGYHTNLRSFVRAVGEDTPVSTLTPDHLIEWWATLRHRRPSSKCFLYSTMVGFVEWLRRRELVTVDLLSELRRPPRPRRVPRYMSPDQIVRLLAVCPDARARAILFVMVGMGLRRCEVAGLEIADWDQEGEMMLVRKGKGGNERRVPVPSAVASALRAYLAEHPTQIGSIFRGYLRPYGALGRKSLSVLVSQWMREAGVKTTAYDGRSAHALRHTCATNVLDQCSDLRVVQQMLGHANLATTAIYLDLVGIPKMREAMEACNYRTAS